MKKKLKLIICQIIFISLGNKFYYSRMKKMFVLLLVLFSLTFEQSPNITLEEIKDPRCSNNSGKIEFNAKISYSELPRHNSYFILNLQNSNGQMVPSICKLGNASQNNQSDSDEDYGQSLRPTNEIDSHSPHQPDEPKPEKSNEINSDFSSTPDEPSPLTNETGSDLPHQSDEPNPQTNEPDSDSPHRTDEPSPLTNDEADSDSPHNPDESIPQTIEADTISPHQSDEPEPDSTYMEDSQSPFKPDDTEQEPKMSFDDLKKLFEQLRSNLEDRFNQSLNDIQNLDEVNEDLKYILNFKLMKLIKNLSLGFDNITNRIIEVENEKIVKPLDSMFTEIINKLNSIEYEKIKIKINESICQINTKVADRMENRYSNLKKILERFIRIQEEIFGVNITSFLNKNTKKIIEIIELVSQGKFNESILEDININITEIKEKITTFIDYNLTEVLNKSNNYLINNLLYIEDNIEEIYDVIQANGTFLDVIKKINETVKETIEKIKEQINSNEKLKSLIEKIKVIKKNITEKIKALILTEDEIKAKINEIKNYLNNSDDEVIQQIRTIISKIKALREEKRKELEEFLVEIKDMTPEEIIEEIKNRTKINQIEEKIKKQLLKLKDLDTKIFDKIMNITKNVNNYLSKNSTLKDIIEQLSELNKEIKKALNGTDLENSINSLIDF